MVTNNQGGTTHKPEKIHDTMSKEISGFMTLEAARRNVRGPKTITSYRNFYDIIYDLLYITALTGHRIRRSRACLIAGLSGPQIQRYISQILLPQGLVDYTPDRYMLVTEKGRLFLETHQKTRKLLGLENYEDMLRNKYVNPVDSGGNPIDLHTDNSWDGSRNKVDTKSRKK